MPLRKIRASIEAGRRLTRKDAIALFESDDLFTLGELASTAAMKRNGRNSWFVRNIHINPTNICVNRCRFCAFSRSMGQEGAYELSLSGIVSRIRAAWPLSEVHIVGGLHPDWPLEHYVKMLRRIRKTFPSLHIKAFTAVEIDYMQRISGLSLQGVLMKLKEAGLGSMPGGGAEIFSESVRGTLCPEKIPASRWLEVMEAAHGCGIKTNATMLYGHVETCADRADHLLMLRDLQDRTGGFQAFIPLAYHPKKTAMGGEHSSGLEDLRTIAVSRLVLDNFPHIKAYWVMLGEKISQMALLFGADDLDGTVIEENITHAAGGESRRGITAGELRTLIRAAGRRPIERDSFYRKVRHGA